MYIITSKTRGTKNYKVSHAEKIYSPWQEPQTEENHQKWLAVEEADKTYRANHVGETRGCWKKHPSD